MVFTQNIQIKTTRNKVLPEDIKNIDEQIKSQRNFSNVCD
jgi:hypothetical protein